MFGGTAGPKHDMRKQAAWLVVWIVAYGLVAFGLLLATLRSFNRCLGRLDESSSREKPFPRPAREPATRLPDVDTDFAGRFDRPADML